MRTEAERVSRLKDEFLSTLGHELRAPLHAVLGWSRLLESGRLAPEDVQRGGQTIDRNVRILAQLVDDLIDMSGLLSGRLRLDPEETDLAQIVEAALETMQATADAKGVRLEKNAAGPGLPGVWRSAAPAAGRLEPAQQRGEVHTTRRRHHARHWRAPRATGK